MPLTGRRIAVFEHRELDRLARMLEAQGAEALRCPMVKIVDAPDPAPVLDWIGRAIETPFDDLVLMTGEGLRRLCGFAGRTGREPAFREALGRMRTITRGPKPARALREVGLAPTIRAPTPTTDGVIAALSDLDLRGRRIGVQLYPEADSRLIQFLSTAGASPDPVLPYAYVPESDPAAVVALVKEIAGGRVDAVAFTSAAQVVRLFEIAREAGEEASLRSILDRTAVAAVGPVVAGELRRRGAEPAIMPADSFFMKPLVSAITDHFSG
ncbi:MAG TPA: uroporphyrinogen-III synthase [Stellaceae bacterium]